MGSQIFGFLGYVGIQNGKIPGEKKPETCCLLNLTISSHYWHYHYWQGRCINRKWLSWDRKNYIFLKVTKVGSIIGQKIDCNGVGAPERPPAHTQQTFTQVPPPPPPPPFLARAPLPWLNSDSFPPRPVIMITSGIINTKFDRRLQPLTVDLSIITFCRSWSYS